MSLGARQSAAVAGIVATTAVLAALAALAPRGRGPSDAPSPPATEGALAPDSAVEALWPRDARQRLTVDWQTHAAGRLEGSDAELETDVRIRGELELGSYGVRDGATWLRVRWSRVDAGSVTALGAERLDQAGLAERLRALEAVAVIAPHGALHELRFAPGSDVTAQRLTRSLLLELTAQLAAARGSSPVVDTALGRARVERARTDAGVIALSRSAYEELAAFPSGFDPAEPAVAAKGEVVTTREGLSRVTSDEELAVEDAEGPVRGFRSTTSLRIESVARSVDPLGDVPAHAAAPLRGVPDASTDRRASLERRAAGVTPATLVSDVRLAGLLPPPGPTEWVWHDSAFLELRPEEAAPLLDRAAKELDARGRAAAVDVVVIAGTPEGQRALVAALSTWAARDPAELVVLAQRLGYLRAPTDDTIAFVAREQARLRGTDPGYAYAFALGALAATRARTDRARAAALVAPLVTELGGARTAAAREALLRALGNAGLEATAASILAHRADASADVRRAVAASLRKMEGGEVLDALLALTRDEDEEVAREALASAFRKELDDEDWAALESGVKDGRIPIGALDLLASSAALRAADSPRATAILVALLASPRTPPRLATRLESILGDGGAPAEDPRREPPRAR